MSAAFRRMRPHFRKRPRLQKLATIESSPALIRLALRLGFAVQPLAENQQRRILLTYRSVGQIPALVFAPDYRKWRNQPARDQRITNIRQLRYSDPYSVEHRLYC